MKITPEKLDEVIRNTRNTDNFRTNGGVHNMVKSINGSMQFKEVLSTFIDKFYQAIQKDGVTDEIEKAQDACGLLMVYGSVLIEVGYHLAKEGVEIYDAS